MFTNISGKDTASNFRATGSSDAWILIPTRRHYVIIPECHNTNFKSYILKHDRTGKVQTFPYGSRKQILDHFRLILYTELKRGLGDLR
jgi:hypothetical protein